jgi:hypothetical protein
VADADQVAMERRRDLDTLKCQPNHNTTQSTHSLENGKRGESARLP